MPQANTFTSPFAEHHQPPTAMQAITVTAPPSFSSANPSWTSSSILAVVLGVALGLLAVNIQAPTQLALALLALFSALAIIVKIEFGLLLLIFITYTNMSTVAIEYYNAPSIAKILILLLVLGILARQIFTDDELPAGTRRLSAAIGCYGLVGLGSLLFAPDTDAGLSTISNYLKDSFLAILVVIILKRGGQLRLASWAILLGGAFLGSIGTYQHITGTFENPYWGFSQANALHIVDQIDDYRIAGPIGGPNYFAQFLLVVVPLAIERLFGERRLPLRLLAIYTMIVCLLALVYTYSRGGLVALSFMALLYLVLQPRRSWLLILFAVIVLPLVQFIPAQYFNRMNTLQAVMQGKKQAITSEVSFRGRLSEMIVAYKMFADHPFRGIGLGNYERHYQKYAQKVFLDTRREERNAHCRYLEILAETGLIGFASFGFLLWLMFRGVQRAHRHLRDNRLRQYEGLVVAFTLAMSGFLTAYLFLHDAYPRFFWILTGILFAIPNVTNNELSHARSQAEVEGKPEERHIPITTDAHPG